MCPRTAPDALSQADVQNGAANSAAIGAHDGYQAPPLQQQQQRAAKKPPPAPSAGAKDVDFGALSVKGGRGYRFSFKTLTWGDTAVKVWFAVLFCAR